MVESNSQLDRLEIQGQKKITEKFEKGGKHIFLNKNKKRTCRAFHDSLQVQPQQQKTKEDPSSHEYRYLQHKKTGIFQEFFF